MVKKEQQKIPKPEKAVFLDRDGVINRHKRTLVKSWSEFQFLPEAKESIKKLVDLDYKVIVVTNQDVVGWSIISEKKLREIHKKMNIELDRSGGHLTDIFYCHHNPMRKCNCRKPQPGMLISASKKYNITPQSAWMVGDKLSDIQAGSAFGCKTILISKSIKNTIKNTEKKNTKSDSDYIVKSLAEAVKVIIEEDG